MSPSNAVDGTTAGRSGRIVIAGAGYAGLHVALRLAARLRSNPQVELTLVDRHDYHQTVTELPRVAGGTRAADAVRIPLQDLLASRVRFVRTEINDFDLAGQRLLTGAGPMVEPLVPALGSRPTTSPSRAWPSARCRCIRPTTPSASGRRPAKRSRPPRPPPTRSQRRLATVVVGGGGATGVELAGQLAETLPEVAKDHGLTPDRPAVWLIEVGPTIWLAPHRT